MTNCKNCGAVLGDGRYCQYCGADTGRTEFINIYYKPVEMLGGREFHSSFVVPAGIDMPDDEIKQILVEKAVPLMAKETTFKINKNFGDNPLNTATEYRADFIFKCLTNF